MDGWQLSVHKHFEMHLVLLLPFKTGFAQIASQTQVSRMSREVSERLGIHSNMNVSVFHCLVYITFELMPVEL